MRPLFDIALLPDMRSQWSTTAEGNLKMIASRFRIDTATICKTQSAIRLPWRRSERLKDRKKRLGGRFFRRNHN